MRLCILAERKLNNKDEIHQQSENTGLRQLPGLRQAAENHCPAQRQVRNLQREREKEQEKEMSKTVVLLTGFAQVGKDTFAKRLVEEHGFTRVAFADPMREALLRLNPNVYIGSAIGNVYQWWAKSGSSSLYADLADLIKGVGWDAAKIEVPDVRKLLQRFGTEVGREMFGETFWVDLALKKIAEATTDYVVVTDARFENEVTHVRECLNASVRIHVVKILRPGVGSVNDHKSDAGLPDRCIDRIVWNDGSLHKLNMKADGMVEVDLIGVKAA